MAEKFEIMKLRIPLTLDYSSYKAEGEVIYTATLTPIDDESTIAAWKTASELATQGWELVGSVPITAYSYPAKDRGSDDFFRPRELSHSYTSGYELLFKRRLS